MTDENEGHWTKEKLQAFIDNERITIIKILQARVMGSFDRVFKLGAGFGAHVGIAQGDKTSDTLKEFFDKKSAAKTSEAHSPLLDASEEGRENKTREYLESNKREINDLILVVTGVITELDRFESILHDMDEADNNQLYELSQQINCTFHEAVERIKNHRAKKHFNQPTDSNENPTSNPPGND